MTRSEPIGFDKARKKAESFVDDREKTGNLINKAVQKANKYKESLGQVWTELQGFFRMLQAWKKGEYKSIPWKTLVMIIGAVIYFVNPFDLIVDLIPFVGFLDDISVIGFVVHSIRIDIEKFAEWELQKGISISQNAPDLVPG